MGIVMVASWIIVYVGRGVVEQVVNLHFLDLPAQPYFQPSDAWLLYILTPLVAIGSLIMWLLPGTLLILAFGNITHWTEWMLKAFAISLIAYFLFITTVKLVTPADRSSLTFAVAVVIGSLAAFGILARRVWRGDQLTWPFSQPGQLRRLSWSILIPLLVLWLMLPVIFWQDMHDDGFEVLELGRSLSSYLWVRFPKPAGISGLGVGLLPEAFPIHWFISLFGPFEASARLPLLLYLPVIFCTLVALIEWRSPKKLGAIEEMLLILALGIFVVTMSYNASYDVYFADIAAPTATETLTVLCLLAMIYFLWLDNIFWFFLYAMLAYLSRPIGLMILGLLLFAVIWVMSGQNKRTIILLISGMAMCFLTGLVYDKLFVPLLAESSEVGYQSITAIKRMRYIRLFDFSRLYFGLLPSGILPFLSLLFYRWQDKFSRIISIMTLLYFSIFFFQGYVALHHFAPVMVFPLVVFWRIYLFRLSHLRRQLTIAVLITASLALFLSLPRSFNINRTIRRLGQKISIQVGSYETDHQSLVQHDVLLFKLFPPDWDVPDASRELITGFNSLIYYGTRPKSPDSKINYIVQFKIDPKPPGFTKVAEDDEAVIYVKDMNEWSRDRYQNLDVETKSKFYEIPRSTLFYYFFWRDVPQKNLVIDLKQVLDHILVMIR